MCEPTTAAMMIISAATTAANIAAQNRQAAAEEKAANEAAYQDYLTLQDRMYQDSNRFNLQALERQRQAARDRAQIAVAAGEAGVGGNSLLRMLNQSLFKQAYDIGIHQANLESARAQTRAQAGRVAATHQSRIASARAKRVNPFLGALQIGSSAYQAYHSVPRIE